MRFRLPLLVICLLASTAFAQNGKGPTKSPIEQAFERLEYRSIGPAIMGGRIADVEGVPGDPNVVYVASASGGLWKTTNGGVKWTPIFERQGTLSIGDFVGPRPFWAKVEEASRKITNRGNRKRIRFSLRRLRFEPQIMAYLQP